MTNPFRYAEINTDDGYFVEYFANFGQGRVVTPSTSWLMVFYEEF
jgi:hypothetical protein